jgi:hypothetical protein
VPQCGHHVRGSWEQQSFVQCMVCPPGATFDSFKGSRCCLTCSGRILSDHGRRQCAEEAGGRAAREEGGSGGSGGGRNLGRVRVLEGHITTALLKLVWAMQEQ